VLAPVLDRFTQVAPAEVREVLAPVLDEFAKRAAEHPNYGAEKGGSTSVH
jgi:hypothetical protein